MFEDDDGEINSSFFSFVACFVFVHAKMNLLNFADLAEEFLDKSFIDWAQEMTKVN